MQNILAKLRTASTSGSFRRSPLVVLGFLIFFVVAAYKTADFVIAGDMTGLAFVALAFTGGAIVIAILNNWRNGLYFFLAWLLFEDFARKFLGNNMGRSCLSFLFPGLPPETSHLLPATLSYSRPHFYLVCSDAGI